MSDEQNNGPWSDEDIERDFIEAMTPNWDALTAKQIAAVIESAPVVLGEWSERRAFGSYVRLGLCAGKANVDLHGLRWRWAIHGPGAGPDTLDVSLDEGRAPTCEAAMAAADAAARERGWRLMGGE